MCAHVWSVHVCGGQSRRNYFGSRHFRVRGYNMFLSHAWQMTRRWLYRKTHVTSVTPVLSSLSITFIMISPFHPSLPSLSVLPELSHDSSVYFPQFPHAGRLPGVQLCWISSTLRLNLQEKKKKKRFPAKVPSCGFLAFEKWPPSFKASKRRIERL